MMGQIVACVSGLIRIWGGSDDDGLLVPRLSRQLRAQHAGHVDLDADSAAVPVVGGPVGAKLKGADVAEGAPVLATCVGVERPAKAHALDGVQGRLALDLEVLDVRQPGLWSFHWDMLEQMFVLNKLGFNGVRSHGLLARGAPVGAINRSHPQRRSAPRNRPGRGHGPRLRLASCGGGSGGESSMTGRSRSRRIPRTAARARCTSPPP